MGYNDRRAKTFILTILMLFVSSGSVTAASKQPGKTQKKSIVVFSTHARLKIPVLLYGQLENRLIATFSASESFSCQTVPDIRLDAAARVKLSESLLILSTNSSAKVKPVQATDTIIGRQRLIKLSRRYLLIFPTVTEYSMKHLYVTETNKPGRSRTNIIKVLTNRFHIRIAMTLHTLNPYDGKIRQLANIRCTTNTDNKFTSYSAVVTSLGKRLSSVIENSSLFDLETEINHVYGNTIFFFHKNTYPLSPGQEFLLYEQKRYEDGYIDEFKRGTIRIIEKNGALWTARVIQGSRPKNGYKIRPESQAGITFSPRFQFYLPDIPGNLFTPPADVDFSFSAVPILYGPSLEMGFQLGYNFQLYLGGDWLFDATSEILQINAGFGWDIYAARNLFFGVSISVLLRWLHLDLGKITDGGALNGATLTAKTFVPGMRGEFSLNWIPGRVLGGFLLFRLAAGYDQFAEIQPSDWGYTAAGTTTGAYTPGTVRKWSPGGFYSSAGLSLRF